MTSEIHFRTRYTPLPYRRLDASEHISVNFYWRKWKYNLINDHFAVQSWMWNQTKVIIEIYCMSISSQISTANFQFPRISCMIWNKAILNLNVNDLADFASLTKFGIVQFCFQLWVVRVLQCQSLTSRGCYSWSTITDIIRKILFIYISITT